MIKKISKFLLIFLAIFGIVFSNIPFYAVSSAFNAYVKSYNIVDKAWHLQKDSNVVDKFASFRNLTEELKIKETYAATSGQVYPTLGVTIAEDPWLDNNWTTPTNVYSDNAATAYVIAANFDSPDQTFVLKATGFDFSAIPDGSTINGVTARVNAWYRSGQGAGAMDLCQLLDINKAKVGTNQCATQVALTTTNTTIITKGSAADKWGNALDTTWIKDPDFGIAIGIKATAANADVDVDYVTLEIDYTPPADSTAPTPNPMTFATAPNNTSATEIGMTATTATDVTTPPVSYYFALDTTVCTAANIGTGAADSGWQSGTTYSDIGLAVNKCYGYKVKARDSVGTPNETGYSGITTLYTSANTPSAPTVGSPTQTTLVITNNENGNPLSNPITYFAVQVTTADGNWNGRWVNASGASSATAVWLTDTTLTNLTVTGLTGSTLYDFNVKARNEDLDETGLSAAGSGTTSAPSGPDATSYTNATETGLNFSACGTTGCGARITTGTDQTITIAGTTFGTVSAGSRANCSGGAGTGCVRIANYTIPDANVIAWADTSIQFRVPSAVTVFGGSGTICAGADGNGVCVTAAGTNDTNGALQFWVFPDITSISPSGAGEGKEGDSITISGNRFDTTAGTVTIAGVSATVGTWIDASITVTVPTAISDSTNTGDVVVTRAAGTGSKTDTSTNFTILPEIVSTSVCSGCSADADREYDTGVNTYGIITLNGKHFGTNGTSSFDGISATQHTVVEGGCTTATYTNTAVCFRVPAAIPDNDYTVNIALTRTAGPADNKNHTYPTAFRILPKITNLSPDNGPVGTAITINGDHLCQDSGTCPSGFDASNKVTFTSNVTSTVFTSWSNTAIQTAVPTGAITGDVVVTSNNRTSNGKTFTVASTVPNSPTNLQQYKTDWITEIGVGSSTNQTSVIFEGDISAGTSVTMWLELEVKATSTAFNGTVTASSSAFTGTSFANVTSTVSGLSNGVEYHWRARTKNSLGEASSWVAFGNNPTGDGSTDGSPANTDFYIDTSAPVITNATSTNITDAQADITWNTNENATRQVGYSNANGSCASGADAAAVFGNLPNKQPGSPSAISASPHSITLSILTAGATYYYKIRASDAAGNVSYDPADTTCRSFSTTAAQTRIMKTIDVFIQQATSTTLSNFYPVNFDVFLAESNTSRSNITIRSAFVEVWGISRVSSGNITVGVDFQSGLAPLGNTDYTIDPGGTAPTFWSVTKQATGFNWDCSNCNDVSNTLNVTASSTGSIVSSLVGARLYVTYNYVPQ